MTNKMTKGMIIALDGTAASGKGTLGRRLAQHYKLDYLDTGTLYRALALHLIKGGATKQDVREDVAGAAARTLDLELTKSPEIRTDRVTAMASVVAAMPPVRANFVEMQRSFAQSPPNGGGAILDGRDIGSVIIPDAPVKFYIDAKLEVRAERRFKELQTAGESVKFPAVLEDMRVRDARDRERSVSPLVKTGDACVIDTSQLGPDEVFDHAVKHITETLGQS